MTEGAPDWAAWSREAVALAQERNRTWVDGFGLAGALYRWDLEAATFTFERDGGTAVVADLCIIGTASASEGSFLWAWANDALPAEAHRRLEEVRKFGQQHELGLLTTPTWPGGRAEGLEMLAIAARVLDGEGTWVDTSGDLTMFFVLSRLRAAPAVDPADHPGS